LRSAGGLERPPAGARDRGAGRAQPAWLIQNSRNAREYGVSSRW
jgi:hypothetical protein